MKSKICRGEMLESRLHDAKYIPAPLDAKDTPGRTKDTVEASSLVNVWASDWTIPGTALEGHLSVK
jgi:hypothetical protein